MAIFGANYAGSMLNSGVSSENREVEGENWCPRKVQGLRTFDRLTWRTREFSPVSHGFDQKT